jgi:hypothetical protein
MTLRSLVFALATTAVATTLAAPTIAAQTESAQNTAAPRTGKAHIAGVVLDSLNGGYLSGADVMIEGVTTTLRTDSLGRFSIDTLPPGTYQIGVFHPLLDTLNTALTSKPFRVGPDSTSFVLLAVPSPTTLIRSACPKAMGGDGMSAVIGHVNDPERLTPIAKAEVSVAWTTIEVSKEFGIRRSSHLVRDTTDASGSYRICGVPSSLHATLQARRGSAVTAEIPIALGDRPIELLTRNLLLASDDSVAKTGTASVSGVVTLQGSGTNAGSRVELLGTDMVALTNEKGEFTMQNLPSGSKVLMARHLGYAAETIPVDLSSREQSHVTIALQKYVAVMDPVLVTARRTAALDRTGFGQRRKSGAGYFLGPEQIEKMHPFRVTDLLRSVPGLRVTPGQFGDMVSSTRDARGGCVQYFLDEMPYKEMTPGDISDFVNAHEVVAVEVYQSGMAPAQFIGTLSDCTTIVFWTRFRIRS